MRCGWRSGAATPPVSRLITMPSSLAMVHSCRFLPTRGSASATGFPRMRAKSEHRRANANTRYWGRRLATTDGTWKNRLDPALLSWLGDHVVEDSMVLPGTAYIEMAVSAVLSTHACDGVEIEGFEIRRPVLIAAGAMPLVEVGLSGEDGAFRLRSGETSATMLPPVAVARAAPLASGPSERTASVEAIRGRMGKRVDGGELYRRFAAHGLIYGPAFRGVAEVWAGKNEALGRIVAPAVIATELGEYRIHPALLDACLQITLATIPDQPDQEAQIVFVPSRGGADPFLRRWRADRLVSYDPGSVRGSFDCRRLFGAGRRWGDDRQDRQPASAPCRSGWSE